MAMYLALDLGTTAVKCAVFDRDGRRVALSRAPYSLSYPRHGWVECPADTYKAAIETALASCRSDAIAAVALSSQANTLLCVDAAGQPLRDAIVWTDFRAGDEAAELKAALGDERFSAATGAPDLCGMLMPCKIVWLRRHEPRVFAATHRFLDIKQYVLSLLGGAATGDPSLRGIEGIGRIEDGRLWPPMVEAIDVEPEKLAPLAQSHEPVGGLNSRWAALLGAPPGIPIFNGCLDQVAAGTGAGCVAPGTAALNFGGVLAFFSAVTAGAVQPAAPHLTGPHVQPGCWYLLPYLPAAGLAVEWLLRCLGDGTSLERLAAEAAEVPPGCEGLTALPHLTGLPHRGGECVRGGFMGLGSHHGPAHLYRAILESLAFCTVGWLKELADAGVHVQRLRALGGGARSSLWLQVTADTTGVPVELPRETEASCLGAAMLAAWGLGHFPDLQAVADAWVVPDRVVEPDPAARAPYDDALARFLRFNEFAERNAHR